MPFRIAYRKALSAIILLPKGHDGLRASRQSALIGGGDIFDDNISALRAGAGDFRRVEIFTVIIIACAGQHNHHLTAHQLGAVNPAAADAQWQVDGLSGATLTTKGVHNLVQYWLGDGGFAPLLGNLRGGNA